MREKKFFYKKGKRYIGIDEYRDGFWGMPVDGLLSKTNNGFSCFLPPKEFDKDLNIEKLSYFNTKTYDITKKIMDSNLHVYNTSLYDFCSDVIKKLSKF